MANIASIVGDPGMALPTFLPGISGLWPIVAKGDPRQQSRAILDPVSTGQEHSLVARSCYVSGSGSTGRSG